QWGGCGSVAGRLRVAAVGALVRDLRLVAVRQEIADLREELFAGRRDLVLGRTALAHLGDLVHRHDDDEVYDRGDDDEVDRRGDDRTQIDECRLDLRADPEAEPAHVRGADRGDHRIDDLVGDRRDDRGEGTTDDD